MKMSIRVCYYVNILLYMCGILPHTPTKSFAMTLSIATILQLESKCPINQYRCSIIYYYYYRDYIDIAMNVCMCCVLHEQRSPARSKRNENERVQAYMFNRW